MYTSLFVSFLKIVISGFPLVNLLIKTLKTKHVDTTQVRK